MHWNLILIRKWPDDKNSGMRDGTIGYILTLTESKTVL